MSDIHQVDVKKSFRINEWIVDPDLCRIKNAHSEVKLEPKAMTVLLCLAENANQVLSREQLEDMAWRDLIVGYDSLASSINKLRKAFGDDSRNPRYIETVPKKGYRLIANVTQEADSSIAESVSDGVVEVTETSSTGSKKSLIAILLVSLTATFGIWVFLQDNQTALNEKPTIAVLPFHNLSNDPEQDYFSDGMTADIITDLSKVSGISVISRNSVFAYRGNPLDIRMLARELGVSHVVEGSVRKVSDSVRITASLIDVTTGHNLWADRFDGTLKNIFRLQDEVTQKIVNSLAITLTDYERTQLALEYTKSIQAYDEFLQGWQLFWFMSNESNLRAREHFHKAIELDENFARAYANLALTYAYDYLNAWHDDPKFSLSKARSYAKKGVALDPNIPQVHWVEALTYMFGKQYKEALKSAEQTLVLDPNYADGYGIMSTILNYAGQPKKALEIMKKAMRLNPHYPSIYQIIRAEIHFNLRDYDNAIKYLELALQRNPVAQEGRLWLAAAYAHINRIEDAMWQLDHIRQTNVNLNLEYVENVVPLNDPQQRRHFLDGLYKAGLENN